MKRTLAASGAFLIFLLAGGLWVTLGRFLPDGMPRSVVTIALALVFVGTFVFLLGSRVRALLGGSERWQVELLLALMNVALLLIAFGTLYQRIGITDTTKPDNPVTTDFWECLYFSLVTFTTLGYGDLQPHGLARVLAVIEAFGGYLVLGVLASTTATLLSPREEPGL